MESSQASSNLSTETHWEFAAKTRMGKYLTKIETDFINKSVDLSKENITVMDVGAEAGRFSLIAANKKTTVVSVDVNSYALKRLKQKSREVNVILADARVLPIKDGVFDVVFMIEVLDYIPELEQALAECKRSLKPHASSVVSFGNSSSLKARLKAMKGKSYRHSYEEVIQCLVKTGFIIKRKMGYSWLPLGRTSQNNIVFIMAGVERLFGFRRLVKFSPWVIMQITKLF